MNSVKLVRIVLHSDFFFIVGLQEPVKEFILSYKFKLV